MEFQATKVKYISFGALKSKMEINMPIDLEMFANKVNRYCDQFQVSLNEMADQTGIQLDRLVNITSCKNAPTGDEVLIIADFFKCDYKFFISNEKLAPFEQTEELFRSHGDDLSKRDRWNIQEFLFLCECQHFLLHIDPETRKIQPFEFKKTGQYYKEQGAQAAASLRRHLGYKPIELPRNIYKDFRSMGIHVFRRKLGESAISGIYILHPVAGHCILVNYSEDMYRQRFTAAHEVAHAILDDDKDFVVSYTRWGERDLSEFRANTFASHFLMPPEFLTRIPEPRRWDSEKILEYSRKLMVNPEPLAYALNKSNLITREEVNKFKSLKIPRQEKLDPEISTDLSERGRIRKETLLQKGLSNDYVSLCLDAYEKSIISRGRLIEILLVDETEIDELCELYGRKLNYVD